MQHISPCHPDAPPSQDVTGYAELLYSITDNDQLFREGSLEPTQNFIGSMTQVAQAAITGVFSDGDHMIQSLGGFPNANLIPLRPSGPADSTDWAAATPTLSTL